MKTIKINESQFNKIMEAKGSSAPSFDNGDVKDYNGSEISSTANIPNQNGNNEYGEPNDADKLQSMMSMQNYWANASTNNGRASH